MATEAEKNWIDVVRVEPDYRTMQEFVGDGATDTFEINFTGGYLNKAHVKGESLDEVAGVRTVLELELVGTNTFKVSPVPGVGHIVTLYRDTPKEVPMLSFVDGAMITAPNLDRNAKQAIFSVAEMLDRFSIAYKQVELAEMYARAAQAAANQAGAQAAFIEEIFEKFKLTDEMMAEMHMLQIQSEEAAREARDYADSAAGSAGAVQAASLLFATIEEAQQAHSDGKLVEGSFCFVISKDDSEIAVLHRVVTGVVKIYLDSMSRTKTIPSKKAVDSYLVEVLNRILVEEVPVDLAGVPADWVASVAFADGRVAPVMNDKGRLISASDDGTIMQVAFEEETSDKYLATIGKQPLPDGAIMNRVLLNEADEIVEAWTDDGGHYTQTPDGLVRTASGEGPGPGPNPDEPAERLDYITGIVWNAFGYGTTRISVESFRNGKKVLYVMVTFGQSLAQAYSQYAGDTLVATTKKYPNNAFMFSSPNAAGSKSPRRSETPVDSFEALEDSVVGGLKETVGSSFTTHLIAAVEAATGSRINVLHYVAAEGGKAYRDLMKGTFSWSTLVQGLIDAKRVGEKAGYEVVVLGMDFKGGESDTDQTGGMYPALYARYLQNLDREFNAEVKRIFGGKHPDVPVFVEQCSFQPHAAGDGRVRFGQLLADGMGNVRCTGASYQYPHPGDVIHIASLGQNMRGVQLARAAAWECFGVGHRPLAPREFVWTSPSTVEIIFNLSVPMIKDTSGEVVNPEGLGSGAGFRITNMAGAVVPILVSEMVTTGRLRLTLDNAGDQRLNLTYASYRTGDTSQGGPEVGARGLFRTQGGHTNLYTGKTEYVWLPAFALELR